MANRPKIPVFQGANVWRLVRTDRDGAAREDIPQMAAAACRTFLLDATGAKHELVATGPKEWRFGAVRPLRVLAVSRQPMTPSSDGPTARLVADRQTVASDVVPTVRAQRPWFVFVQFFWREPNTTIDYPALQEGLFGRSYQLSGADWLLDKAWHVPGTADPGDQTWGDAMGDRARAAAAEATDTLGRVLGGAGFLGVLVLLYWLSRK